MSAASVTPVPGTTARAARPRSALLALTRAEGRRLLRHPLFVLGMAISTVILVGASGNSPNEGGAFQQEIVDFLVGGCFLFMGGAIWTFLATFLAASREQRDGANEFYAGQLAAPRTRMAAALLSVGYAGAAAAALVGTATLVLLGPDGGHDVLGTYVAVSLVGLAQGPLYIVLAGVLGVLLGSWTRHVWVAVLVAVAVFLPPIELGPWFAFGEHGATGSVAAVPPGAMPGLASGWHLLAMAGLAALAASLVMLRHDQRLRVVLLACAGLGATAAFVIAAPPTPGIGMGGAPPELRPGGSPSSVPARGTPANFETSRSIRPAPER